MRMTRAKEWSAEVEDAYRLQEAGYKDEREALSLGHPPIERWPGGEFCDGRVVLVCRRECGVHGTAVALSAWWRMQARRPLPSTATAAARTQVSSRSW